MSSTPQINTNRLNAQASTGPSTPEGKATSSRNATTHGLAGSFGLLPHEDRAAFHRLCDGYAKRFRPADEPEAFLVESMVQSLWKTARLHRLETAVIAQMSAQDSSATDPDAMLAAAMLKGSANAYAQVQRYLAAAERSYFRALEAAREGAGGGSQSQANQSPGRLPQARHPSETRGAPTGTKRTQFGPPKGFDFMRKLAHSVAPKPKRPGYPDNLALCL